MNVIGCDEAIELIRQYVPEKYHPGAGKPVMVVVFLSQDEVSRNSVGIPNTNPHHVLGLSIDTWKIFPEAEKDDGRFVVYLSNELLKNKDQLLFTLLHEFGHIDRWSNPDRAADYGGKEELYADMYAFEALWDKVGLTKAMELMNRYCSKHGFAKEVERHRNAQ